VHVTAVDIIEVIVRPLSTVEYTSVDNWKRSFVVSFAFGFQAGDNN